MTTDARHQLPLSTPAEQQMNEAIMSAAAEAATRLSNLLAYVVVRNGFLVCEHYYQGRTAGTKNHIRSVTKSIMSAIVGIAVDRGMITSVERPILDYFPEYHTADSDDRKATITLDHLLTMTAGFEWNELTFDVEASKAVEDWFFGGKQAALYNALPRPLANEPGRVFNYDSPAADLISVILTRAVHQDMQSFAVAHLFDPLGITDFAWEVDPAGFRRGSAGLVMRPRDLAKFGQLYLQRGRWANHQLISSAWVGTSTVSQVALGDGHGYGRLWWVTDGEPIRFFAAVGYGGQLLLVVPSQQLVVVANHEWWDVPGETAVKQSTDFYNQVFVRVVESAQ